MGFDWGSFIGGIVLGAIAGGVYVGWTSLKVGVNLFEQASQQGWINKEELERDLTNKANMARAYRARMGRY